MINSIDRRVSKLAIAILIGGVSFIHPAYAHSSQTESTSSATTRHHGDMDRVEQRIRTMHDRLRLTSKQEPEWSDVAKVMRDNETDIHKLVQSRHENEPMNAVEDLKSYETIADAHADGIKRLIPVFESVYDSLSDAQKANADSMFGKFEGRPAHKASSARSSNNQE